MHDLPPIEDWWPLLPIELKHRILRDLNAPLSPVTLDGIRRIVSGDAGDPLQQVEQGYDIIRLSSADRDFILTQSEPVD